MVLKEQRSIMKSGIWRNLFCAFVSFIILIGSYGCQEKKMADPEGMLKERAVAYWKNRLIEKDAQATYEFEIEKDRMPFKEYQKAVSNAGQLSYSKISVGKFNISGDKATVDMAIKYHVAGFPKALDGNIPNDQWVIENNQWMHVLRKEKYVIPK